MQDGGRFEMGYFLFVTLYHVISVIIQAKGRRSGGHCEALCHYLSEQCFAQPRRTLITTKQYQRQDITNPR